MGETVAFGRAADVESAARRLLADELSFEEFTHAFLHGRLWFRKGEEVGFQAIGARGHGFVPIFTSDQSLARSEGPCDWISTTGLDLLGLVPKGYGFVIDRGGETELWVVPVAEDAA